MPGFACCASGGRSLAGGQQLLGAPACKRDEAIPVRTIIIIAHASARAVCHSNAREGERHQWTGDGLLLLLLLASVVARRMRRLDRVAVS